jgi:hypothetical protein
MSNAWVEHVKKWSKENGKSYACAISNQSCKEEYYILKGEKPKPKGEKPKPKKEKSKPKKEKVEPKKEILKDLKLLKKELTDLEKQMDETESAREGAKLLKLVQAKRSEYIMESNKQKAINSKK